MNSWQRLFDLALASFSALPCHCTSLAAVDAVLGCPLPKSERPSSKGASNFQRTCRQRGPFQTVSEVLAFVGEADATLVTAAHAINPSGLGRRSPRAGQLRQWAVLLDTASLVRRIEVLTEFSDSPSGRARQHVAPGQTLPACGFQRQGMLRQPRCLSLKARCVRPRLESPKSWTTRRVETRRAMS